MPITFNTRVRSRSFQSERMIERFTAGIANICGQKKMAPTLAVLAMANLNFHDVAIPVNLLEKIDPQSTPFPADVPIIEEAKARVKGDHIDFGGTKRREVGPYVLQFNPLRGYRPKGGAGSKTIVLNEPYGSPESPKMNFNRTDPMETFHSEYLGGIKFDFLYNKYPFAPYHFLMVPEKEKEYNQFLGERNEGDFLAIAWDFLRKDGHESSMRIGFNSNGAHASFNHFHFQGFFLTDGWEPPIEKMIRANGGGPFFSRGVRFIPNSSYTLADARVVLDNLHRNNINYNIYMSPDGIAIFPRKHQGDPSYSPLVTSEDSINTGIAFFEMLGEIICPKQPVYDRADAEKVKAIFEAVSLTA